MTIEVAVDGTQPQEDGVMALRFDIRDTGIGIAPAAQQELFREFSQLDRSISRRFGGTGLGLAISQRLVGYMGGTIAVESAPGQGSNFYFTARFPIDPAQTVDADRPKRLDGLRVLVVDDLPANRLVFMHQLRARGAIVEAVASGEASLAALAQADAAQRAFAVVLVDRNMDGFDGITFSARMRDLALAYPHGWC